MKAVIVFVAVAALAGCGVEVATTAATVAAAKKQEIEQGKKTMGQMQQNIGKAMEQSQQRPERTDEAEKDPPSAPTGY
jgi:curli biogenesis system outer membrane secretion channel CsgG